MSNVACSFPGCERAVSCKGICAAHYSQQERGEELHPTKAMLPTVCRMDGCDGRVFTKSRQLCQSHYLKWQRGTLELEPRPCINCGKVFTPKRARTTQSCSRACAMETARLRKTYGLTGADVRAMLEAQDHRCAICRDPIARGNHELHIDHCHGTGRARGLLCSACNRGLGQFKDSPAILRAAAEYLEL